MEEFWKLEEQRRDDYQLGDTTWLQTQGSVVTRMALRP